MASYVMMASRDVVMSGTCRIVIARRVGCSREAAARPNSAGAAYASRRGEPHDAEGPSGSVPLSRMRTSWVPCSAEVKRATDCLSW